MAEANPVLTPTESALAEKLGRLWGNDADAHNRALQFVLAQKAAVSVVATDTVTAKVKSDSLKA